MSAGYDAFKIFKDKVPILGLSIASDTLSLLWLANPLTMDPVGHDATAKVGIGQEMPQ